MTAAVPAGTTGTEPRTPTEPGYVLKLNDVDDRMPGLWFVYRDDEPIAVFRQVDAVDVAGAQRRGEQALRTEGEHVIRWQETHPGSEYRAVTGPFTDQWKVTVYRGRGGLLWSRAPGLDDAWTGAGDATYPTEQALERAQGPLAAVKVDNLAALVEELRIYRARAAYVYGGQECVERECEHLYDDNDTKVLDECPFLETRIASYKDTIGLVAVDDTLTQFEADLASAEKAPEKYNGAEHAELAGVKQVVDAIRYAVSEATE